MNGAHQLGPAQGVYMQGSGCGWQTQGMSQVPAGVNGVIVNGHYQQMPAHASYHHQPQPQQQQQWGYQQDLANAGRCPRTRRTTTSRSRSSSSSGATSKT